MSFDTESRTFAREVLFGRLLVEQRLATQAQVDEGLDLLRRRIAEEADPLPTLGKIMMERGYLTQSQLRQTVAPAEGPGRPLPLTPDWEVPPEVSQALQRPEARVSKYVKTRHLGSGGMGEVWKAWDTELGRWVALKFIRGGTGEDAARFRREAQTAARLSHPNIASVYEARDNYIAMQYIEGQTLVTYPREQPRELVEIVRQAALALQYAHEQGVVHRDVKSANIMVAAARHPSTRHDLEGSPATPSAPGVYMVDFGLAKSVKLDSALTVSGWMVGTPAYASPEQARGLAAADARSDVYSLGVVLYEVLANRLPFVHTDPYELLKQVVELDPPPLRTLRPWLDTDLGIIVMKCLEKDPARRYGSAMELAEDLRRFLAHEPVLARAPSMWYRVRKYVGRRRLMVGLGVAVAVLALGASLLSAILASRGRELERREREAVERMRELTETSLDAALALRRAGDLAGMSQYAEKVRKACGRVIDQAPRLAEPHFRLGRMHRALMNEPEALAEQERSIGKDRDYRPARYERIVLVSRLLRELSLRLERELRLQETQKEPEGVPPRVSMLLESHLEGAPLLAKLAEDMAVIQRDPAGLTDVQVACATALASWNGAPAAEIRSRLEEAAKAGRLPEEGHEALALMPQRRDGDKAVERWTRAIERDRGCLTFWIGRAREHLAAGNRSKLSDREREQAFASAVEDFTRAVELDPARFESWMALGEAHKEWADQKDDWKQRPDALYAAAVEDYGRAIELAPGTGSGWHMRGTTRYCWSDSKGGDVAILRQAIADFSEALRLDPAHHRASSMRGAAYGRLAVQLGKAKEDPESAYRAAVADQLEAVRLDPTFNDAWRRMGDARADWGLWKQSHEQDPRPEYEESIRCFSEGLRVNPNSRTAYRGRGGVRLRMVKYLERAGGDPRAFYEGALEDMEQAIRMNPEWEASLHPRIEECRRWLEAHPK